jgi:hypothetical protein
MIFVNAFVDRWREFRCSRPGLPDLDRWETVGAVKIQEPSRGWAECDACWFVGTGGFDKPVRLDT